MKYLVLMLTLVISGCTLETTTAEEFMIQYDKVKNECQRIVTGENTLYKCKNDYDTMLLTPEHARKASRDGSGWNSGVYAVWGNKQKHYRLEAHFQIW
ncbi:hypothetical protein [Klebsiella phage 05F01]|nr:hypothetical protein [Klebsiella phage 05F01]